MQTIAQTQVHGLFGSSTGGAGNTVAAINPVKRTKEAKNFFIRFSFTQLSIPIFIMTKETILKKINMTGKQRIASDEFKETKNESSS